MLLDYTGAIENYTKALAKFTSEEMDYWQGRVMILLSEAYIFLGMDNKAKHYLNRAEEINKQFNEPLISGLCNLQHAQLLLKEADYENATDSYIECIDQFQIAEPVAHCHEDGAPSLCDMAGIVFFPKPYFSLRWAKFLDNFIFRLEIYGKFSEKYRKYRIYRNFRSRI